MTQRKAQDEANERDQRAERLAAALKENLKRRKTQARGRAGDEPAPAKPARGSDERDQ
jgi:hypothetical protein